MNPKVDWFFEKNTKWQEEYKKLRTIVISCGLSEELKWGCPCYTHDGKNIVLIHGFKEYCALLFMKGALLKDTKHILIQQTPHVQVPRQIRFTTVKEITGLAATIKAYIKEAVEAEKKGLKMQPKRTSDFKMPEELREKLDENPALKKAFHHLTPGRQRGYIFYFSQAKQSKTRAERVAKYTSQILSGKGLED